MIYKKNMFVRWNSVKGDVYIAKGEEAFKIDEIGQIVWNMIDGKTTLEDIIKAIVNKYEVDYNRVVLDVKSFCDDLLTQGLIENAEIQL